MPLCVVRDFSCEGEMPTRKRRTRAVTKSVRHPKATVPSGDSGGNLSHEEKQEKLNVMLRDLDNEGRQGILL